MNLLPAFFRLNIVTLSANELVNSLRKIADTYRCKCVAYRKLFHVPEMGENKLGLQVSRQTPILVLSSTLAMIPAKWENREPMTFPAPACVKNHYGANFERTMTGSYHVFQNQFHSFSRFVRSIDTLRNEIEGIFNRGCTNRRPWTFSYYKETVS